MKRYILLIVTYLVLNSISALADNPELPLGYKTLTEYCHSFDPSFHADHDKPKKGPAIGYCLNKENQIQRTLICCKRYINPGYIYQIFWIYTGGAHCPSSIGEDRNSCNVDSEVY